MGIYDKLSELDPKLNIPLEVSEKGLKMFTLDLDEYEVIETGSKEKEIDGKLRPVAYMKFKLIERKAK